MPMLFSLGQHSALLAIAAHFLANENCSLSTTTFTSCATQIALAQCTSSFRWSDGSRTTLHLGKTKVWNRAGEEPPRLRGNAARSCSVDPEARVWRGVVSQLLSEHGLKILGTLVGQPEFIRAELAKLFVKHRVLLDRISAGNSCQFLPSQCPTTAGPGVRHGTRR